MVVSKLQARGDGLDSILPSGAATRSTRRAMRIAAYTLFALFFVGLLIPVMAVSTPFGQRLTADLIEAPLLERLQAGLPDAYTLDVENLTTTVRASSFQVAFESAHLSGPEVDAQIGPTSVRLRYIDVLRSAVVPRRITIETLTLARGPG
ncbi:MAG: hypothetical protein KI785_08260, partial [Devosiaceae bacterium]|nr:hypothetical protein [Devosiaceae bacterium MH13]